MRPLLSLSILAAATVVAGCSGGDNNCATGACSPSDASAGADSPPTNDAGGGGLTSVYHCDVNTNIEQDCIEYEVGFSASPAADCNTRKGTYSMGACSHAGSAGACDEDIPGAGHLTTWYYTANGETPQQVTGECSVLGNGAVYVAP
jgi:hypothetical protein